jgi:VanZ family protein
VPRPFWLLLLAIAAVAYGSLYPFNFGDRPDAGIVADLIASLRRRPSRGDLVANLILYLPIGLFWALTFERGGWFARIVLGTLFGTAMSIMVEIAQIYDSARSPSLYDVAVNAFSSFVGALAGHLIGRAMAGGGPIRLPDPAAALLAACWLAYRLFPFVPTIDFQQVKNAFKPLFQIPDLGILHSARHAAAWLAFAALAAANRGGSGFGPLALFGALVLAAKPFLIGGTLQLYEVVGLGVALLLCRFIAPRHLLLGGLLLAAIVADGLIPFSFGSRTQAFKLVPFIGFVSGNIAIAAMAILQKAFLYGSAVWLLHRAGWRLIWATLATAAILLGVELLQTQLPGRTAEITDPLLAVLMAALIAFLPARRAT